MDDKRAEKIEKVAIGAGLIGGLWFFLFIILPIVLLCAFCGIAVVSGATH
jgi:hypothetical protein